MYRTTVYRLLKRVQREGETPLPMDTNSFSLSDPHVAFFLRRTQLE
jgi:hypothetical protein